MSVSEITPVYNEKGGVAEWEITVVFEKVSVKLPHARGGYACKQQAVGNVLPVKYYFRDSVMKCGMKNALVFHGEMMERLAKSNRQK